MQHRFLQLFLHPYLSSSVQACEASVNEVQLTFQRFSLVCTQPINLERVDWKAMNICETKCSQPVLQAQLLTLWVKSCFCASFKFTTLFVWSYWRYVQSVVHLLVTSICSSIFHTQTSFHGQQNMMHTIIWRKGIGSVYICTKSTCYFMGWKI